MHDRFLSHKLNTRHLTKMRCLEDLNCGGVKSDLYTVSHMQCLTQDACPLPYPRFCLPLNRPPTLQPDDNDGWHVWCHLHEQVSTTLGFFGPCLRCRHSLYIWKSFKFSCVCSYNAMILETHTYIAEALSIKVNTTFSNTTGNCIARCNCTLHIFTKNF